MRRFAIRSSFTATAMVLVAGLLPALPASAQTVYRIVAPDGRITYSDQPPPSAVNAQAVAGVNRNAANSSAAATAGLPYALAQVAGKYPVTLYTGENCTPCGSGRALLSSRGIPFAEKTVLTAEDIQALQRLSADASLPLLTIGTQQLKGFSNAEWDQFLTAAGYPKTSTLPASYRRPLPTPLVAVAPAVPPRPAEPAPVPATPSSVPALPADNPSGIRF